MTLLLLLTALLSLAITIMIAIDTLTTPPIIRRWFTTRTCAYWSVFYAWYSTTIQRYQYEGKHHVTTYA